MIVLRVDRFAHNVPDGAAQIRHSVDECNAIFGSAQERMDPSTPTGRYMLQRFLNNAELQLNMLKGSWKVAKQRTSAGHVKLLAGIIRCAGCRYRMGASRGGGYVRVYRCSGDHGSGKYPAPAVLEAERAGTFALWEVQEQ